MIKPWLDVLRDELSGQLVAEHLKGCTSSMLS